MKKFEFTGETKVHWTGTILHRIKALVEIDIGCRKVPVGELGGWLEKESNLSGDGNAQVSGDAWVFKAKHYLIMGPMGSRNAITTFFRNKNGDIKVNCGCFHGDIHEFLDKVEKTHGDNKYAVVYRASVQVALEQIDTTPIEEG